MARNLGPTVDILLKRVRQAGGIALSTDLGAQILTISQQIANIHLKKVTSSVAPTVGNYQLVHSYSELSLTSAVDVLEVVDTNRSLFEFKELKDLSAYDVDWFRNVAGTRYEGWCQLGRDLIIIYPAKATGTVVTIDYLKALTISTDYTTDYNDPLELSDEDVELALKLAEVVCLLRSRKPKIIKLALNDALKRFGL